MDQGRPRSAVSYGKLLVCLFGSVFELSVHPPPFRQKYETEMTKLKVELQETK